MNSMKMLRYFLLLLTFLGCTGITQASPQATAILTNQIDRLSLSSHLSILEDDQRTLSIQQVSSLSYDTLFSPNTQKVPNFGRTQSAFWVRFTLTNYSERKWYARINALLGQDVTLYVVNNDGQITTDSIARYLPSHGLPAWSLALPKQQPLQFYIRATNGDAIFSLPIELFAADAFVAQTRFDANLYISIIATLLMIAAYNLLLFFVLRESSYLVLTIHVVSVATIVQITGPIYIGLDFLKNTDAHFFTAPIYIAVISLLFFCRQLLQTCSSVPRLDQLIRGIIFISAGLIFVTGWIPQGTLLPQLMVVLAFILIMLASVIRSLQGYRIAKYFLFIFVLITLIVIPNAIINVIAETQWQSAKFYSTGIATLLFLLLLSILQSEKVREWREQEQRVITNKEATDNFLMTISHELRTPMHTVISIGELLKTTPLTPIQKDYLQKQASASQYLLGLVNDILDIGAMSHQNQPIELMEEPFCLQHILDDLNQFFSDSAEQKGLQLIVSTVPTSCPMLQGDAKRLKQVLVNLLDNAIKYTEQGRVKLNVDVQKDPHLSAMIIRFEIKDTGVGIPVDQQAFLFEPFFQIKHPSKPLSGSGLGLAISHQLVKQMGGELQLRSQSSGGTCFFFTLNLSIQVEDALAGRTVSKETDLVPLKGVHLLLVDDDSLNRLIGQKLLVLQGADVQLASSGREALRLIREQPFDLVLMDLSLPDMDGYEVTQAVRADKNIPDCLIIALTAHAMGNERERCLHAGMNDYLAKPYNMDELIKMINTHTT